MQTKNLTQVSISKTSGEWDVIDKKLSELNRKDLSTHIRCEAFRLKNKLKECPDCVTSASGAMIRKRPYIPKTSYKEIEKIAIKMQISVSAVIDDFIIHPLLHDYGATGNGS